MFRIIASDRLQRPSIDLNLLYFEEVAMQFSNVHFKYNITSKSRHVANVFLMYV